MRGVKTLWQILITLTLIILIIACSYSSKAEIFKYVDSDGIIHFSDRPFLHNNTIYSTNTLEHTIETDLADEIFLDNIIYQASKDFGIDPAIIKAIIKVESDFNPSAVSHAGAKGLMQLMPSTAYSMEVSNPFDPEENIIGGTRYFRYLLDRFNNDLKMSLAAYNAGETTVSRKGGIPRFKETINFVQRVIKYYKLYQNKMQPKDDMVHHVNENYVIQYVDEHNILHITNTSGPFLEKVYP